MSKIAIVFGTSTGETKEIAKKLQGMFTEADLYDAADITISELQPYSFLIFGTSTSGIGDLQDDWESLLPKVAKMDFSGKKVALFGLGDSASFSASFASSMAHIYNALKNKTEIIGDVSVDGYEFDDSDAVINGKFIGLPLDQDNEPEKTDERLSAWVNDLKSLL